MQCVADVSFFTSYISAMKENDAAIDLWTQMFQRMAADPSAAIMDPQYDSAADEARFREAMLSAGWSENEIESRLQMQQVLIAEAPVTSPGVNRDVEAALDRLANDVEAAMARLKLQSQRRVARGVEPRAALSAAKIGVIMTDESVVTVSAFLFRFCGLIARAFTRTLHLNPWLWEADDYCPERARDHLLRAPDLLSYWFRIFASFATTGTHVGVPLRPSTPQEVVLMEQVARAMEVFAIAHEYGHHHLRHGRDVAADLHDQEFEADQFALKICDEVEDMNVTVFPNPYLASGAGGVILLMALETLSMIDDLIGARPVEANTHPSVADRVARLDTVRLIEPAEFARLRGFRLASVRVMTLVREALVPALAASSPEQLEEWRRLRDRMRSG